jgi:PAS domain S-box-containing protein
LKDQEQTDRVIVYWILGIGLTGGLLLGHGVGWVGSAQLHTVMEAIATLLAAVVGAMALVRYYSKKESLFLLIGAGFLGTASLDGFHAIVTSSYFKPMMPSDLPHLIPWSWVASRLYLSVVMFLSWFVWFQENSSGKTSPIAERSVYAGTVFFTLLSFLFFVFFPLPAAYYPNIFFHRPEEFAPALFFLLALIGYLKKGHWRTDNFEHWIVISLIIGFISQAVFMSHSGELFDYEFDGAHTLKKVSYICVLAGLLINMHAVFKREVTAASDLGILNQQLEESEGRVRAIVENIMDSIITIDEKGTIQSVNRATEQIFRYPAEELIGKNIKLLTPEPHRSSHDRYIQNYCETGEAKIIGIGQEVEGQRRDGTTFPMDLSIQDLRLKSGRFFMGVVRDITERKEMDRLKTEFISTVSHELRTPLTSIRGSLGMIGSGALKDPDQVKDMVDLASSNTERLINLVNDLLDMEKLQAGSMEFNLLDLNIGELVEKSLTLNEPFAIEHGVTFKLTSSIEDATVYGDSDRLTQVISNLLSNAAKFSPAGEIVEISIERSATSFRINVSDKGPGIPNEFRDRIFGRFTQADSTDARKKGGTGLGLNISQAIVEKHGGVIGFDSVEGEGSTFYFELPERIRTATAQANSPSEISKAIRAEVPDGGKILVLEDDPDVAKLLSIMLEDNGYDVDIAYNAHEAKARIARTTYAAVTVDVMLPDQDGISLIRELRAEENTHNLATIVVSAKASTVRREVVAASMGIIDWLDKPIDQSRLLSAVQQATFVAQRAEKPRVLHVEDDVDLCQVMTAMIGDTMDFMCAHTFREAQRLLLDEKFDLVILDPGLPDGDGLDLLATLKVSEEDSTPVIIFSSDGVDRETAVQVEAALLKSRCSNEELLDLVSRLAKNGK